MIVSFDTIKGKQKGISKRQTENHEACLNTYFSALLIEFAENPYYTFQSSIRERSAFLT
jgi:hypothetical protein